MDHKIEDWFLNSELEKSTNSGSAKSEKLAKIALAMNQPNQAISFLKNNELISEIEILQGEKKKALNTAKKCNRLFQERIKGKTLSEKPQDVQNILSLLSLRVGNEQRQEGRLFKDK
jgi:hypothetical protein